MNLARARSVAGVPLLVVLFIVVPLVEIYVLIQVGQAIGPWWTIALLLADSIIGSLLLRAQGRGAWRRFNEALATGRPPGREVADGIIIVFGGALLLTPGFATDVVGLACLLPPTRAVIRRVLLGGVRGRIARGVVGYGLLGAKRGGDRMRARRTAGASTGSPFDASRGRDFDVEGTAVDVDDPRLDR